MKNTTNVRSKKPIPGKNRNAGNRQYAAQNTPCTIEFSTKTNSQGKHVVSTQTISLSTEKIGMSNSTGSVSCESNDVNTSPKNDNSEALNNVGCDTQTIYPTQTSSRSSDADSPHERSTMSISASAETSHNSNNKNNKDVLCSNDNYSSGTERSNVSTSSDTISKTSIDTPSIISNAIDPLEVSRFPLQHSANITLNKIQEVKLVQKLLKEIKFVQSFDEDILRDQKKYWLYMHNISDEALRARIKTALETHCQAPMLWITSYEFEINIDPDCKIEKVREYKKT